MSSMGDVGCSATVFGPRVHSWPCGRRGVINRAGKWYCRQHDPEATKARREKSNAAFDARNRTGEDHCEEGRRIAAALGVEAHTHYHRSKRFLDCGFTRSLVIDFDECLKLVEKLRNAERAVAPSASEAK